MKNPYIHYETDREKKSLDKEWIEFCIKENGGEIIPRPFFIEMR